LEKEDIVENDAEHVVQVVDFEEKGGGGSLRRRFWRRKTWWRMILKRLCRW
jgi:hypothetical protein